MDIGGFPGSFGYLYGYAVAGAMLGDVPGFSLGRTGGREWHPLLLRYRRRQALKVAHDLVDRHGVIAVFLGR